MTLCASSVPDPSARHLCMFSTAAFFALRPELRFVRRDVHGDVRASLTGTIGADGFCNGVSAPFAGIDFDKGYHPPHIIAQALDDLLPVGACELKLKPPHWSDNEPWVLHELLRRGFRVVATEMNFVIRTGGGYVDGLKPQTRRAIARADAAGMWSATVDHADDQGWFEAYEVLRLNRSSKGRPTRLPFEYVRALRDTFGDLIRMHTVRAGSTIVAAALVYRVGAGRDLVQYWGDHGSAVSPMARLCADVVAEAHATGARTVDLGISTEAGVANAGLVQFKRSVGADHEVRFVVAR